MGGWAAKTPALYPHPQPQGGEHSSQVSLHFQTPGSLACTESPAHPGAGQASTSPMSQGCWRDQGRPCIPVNREAPQGAVSEVPLGPVRNRWLNGVAEGQKLGWGSAWGSCLSGLPAPEMS